MTGFQGRMIAAVCSGVMMIVALAGCGGKPSWRATLSTDVAHASDLSNDAGLTAADPTVSEAACAKGADEVGKWQTDAAAFPSSPLVDLWSNDLADLSADLAACLDNTTGADGNYFPFVSDYERINAVQRSADAKDDDLALLGS